MPRATSLPLDDPEIKSGFDRLRWAENLIRHLPVQHDGRNSWLINYGTGPDVDDIYAQAVGEDQRFSLAPGRTGRSRYCREPLNLIGYSATQDVAGGG
jgi:hypothetical protein